jgi:hypothetical protein
VVNIISNSGTIAKLADNLGTVITLCVVNGDIEYPLFEQHHRSCTHARDVGGISRYLCGCGDDPCNGRAQALDQMFTEQRTADRLREATDRLTKIEQENEIIESIVEYVRVIAQKLPTGLVDPLALKKLMDELDELDMERWTSIDALSELADVAYYIGKSLANDLISAHRARVILVHTCFQLQVGLNIAVICLTTKYDLRATGTKNKKAENAAIERAMRA